MGQEIAHGGFSERDFAEFKRRLQRETAILQDWFEQDRLAADELSLGYELEACIIDRQGEPRADIQALLQQIDDPAAVPELAQFNIELNGAPVQARGHAFDRFHDELSQIWQRSCRAAQQRRGDLLMAGILPTLQPQHLCLQNMSPLQRYRALNEQVLRLRKGRPLKLDIHGRDHLSLRHEDVMLEAAATSFQLHLKVRPQQAVAFYNASKIVSGPMVAACANAPFLFGRSLWDETRIPLFEQAVSVGASDRSRRVTFGIRYAEHSLFECFADNLSRYPVLLPRLMSEDEQSLPHLRLHNGTIWRWNRPLIGFDNDRPHLRIEHRVIPSGPTVVDATANAALYYCLLSGLQTLADLPQRLPFEQARNNFYACARHGLQAEIIWLDGRQLSVKKLLLQELLPLAEQGLQQLGIENGRYWLDIVHERVASGQNGAQWQRDYVARHDADMSALLRAYQQHQKSGRAVHSWSLSRTGPWTGTENETERI